MAKTVWSVSLPSTPFNVIFSYQWIVPQFPQKLAIPGFGTRDAKKNRRWFLVFCLISCAFTHRELIVEFEAIESFSKRQEHCSHLKKAGISISQMKENCTRKQWSFLVQDKKTPIQTQTQTTTIWHFKYTIQLERNKANAKHCCCPLFPFPTSNKFIFPKAISEMLRDNHLWLHDLNPHPVQLPHPLPQTRNKK